MFIIPEVQVQESQNIKKYKNKHTCYNFDMCEFIFQVYLFKVIYIT